MAKKIKISLSKSGIEKLRDEVQQYRNSLSYKCELLCERLADVGCIIATSNIAESPLGKTITLSSKVSSQQVGCKAILTAVGQTKQAEGYEPINTLLLVEFGAGIRFNKTPNPKANEFGMGVGTFPGQIHAFDNDGWYYLGEDDKWHHTYGVKATMPMYFAGKELRDKVVAIAREVFNS